MKRENVTTRAELENALQAKGSSLDRERKIFTEQFVGQQWIMQKVKPDDGLGNHARGHDRLVQAHIKGIRAAGQGPLGGIDGVVRKAPPCRFRWIPR